MRKKIALLVLVCMMLSSILVNADNVNYTTQGVLGIENGKIIESPIYDMDELANYIRQNIKSNSTEMLVEKYFKNLTKNNDYNIAINPIDSRDISEKLKVVKINDNTKITFYKSGTFSIREVQIEKNDNLKEINDLQPYSEPWEEVNYSEKVEFYNGIGIRYVTIGLNCRYKYNGSELSIIGIPSGSASVNTVVCSLISKKTEVMDLDNLGKDVYTVTKIKTKATGATVAAVMGIMLNENGMWDEYEDIGELD